ncbi:MAG: phage major capsid protein [Anaerococcus vaginalis]|uniref:phage major capsid protein n=2 Tax=Anaerococcus vaginalis TaxID=33037 RepID=UPI0029137787|nr:phage major capsid protein [Anaerococcus vaginalis]MDU4379531.1 phage major capsid protein [Anaerococcus vaginalis]MDU7141599.1 phage major capsid protein [Anaerococcus vaginalis]
MNLKELLETRTKAWDEAKAFAESKKDEKGLMSDEDFKTYEEMERTIENYTREIERKKREEEMDKSLEKPTTQALTNEPTTFNEEEKPMRARNVYKKSMMKALRTNFRDISNELKVGTDESGGYLVPEEMETDIVNGLEDENIVRKLATKVQTSGLHKINIAATKPAALWVEEGGQLTFGDGTFDQVSLDAHKLHVGIKVTEELLYDAAFNLEKYITEEFTRALANAEEDAFLNGDGVNKPTGIFDSKKGGELGGTTKAQTINADELIDLVYSLDRPYRKKAAFILNDATVAQIRKLKDVNGAYIWQPSLKDGEPDRLLGYPAYTSAFAPKADKGKLAVAFGDFSYYKIGDRGNRSFQDLKELFAGNGMVGFLGKERVDGILVLREAVKLLKIGATA